MSDVVAFELEPRAVLAERAHAMLDPADINDRVSHLPAFDEPYVSHTTYGTGSFPFPVYQGTDEFMDTFQVTAALSYNVTPNIKIFGGARAQRFDASSNVSFFNYSVDYDANELQLSRRRRLRTARDRAPDGADPLLEHLPRSPDDRVGLYAGATTPFTENTTTDVQTPSQTTVQSD